MADWDTLGGIPNGHVTSTIAPPFDPIITTSVGDGDVSIDVTGDDDDADESRDCSTLPELGQALPPPPPPLPPTTSPPPVPAASSNDAMGGFSYAYTNPAFRHSTGPVLVTSDRFTSERHLMENHLVYDKPTRNSAGFLDDAHERRHQRKNGSIAVRRVYRDREQKYQQKVASKYATTRVGLPNESVVLNPIHLTTLKDFSHVNNTKNNNNNNNNNIHSNLRIHQNNVTSHHHNNIIKTQRQTAPVLFRSRSKSPRQPHNGGMTSTGGGRGLVGVSGKAGTFRRHRSSDKIKEDYIGFFDIETDKVEKYQYRPGEEVTGAIKIIVKQTFEIRFVELVVVGQGHLTIRNTKDGLARTMKETYLYKHTYVIGTGDSAWSSVLTAGHYTSKFRVKLPSSIPSSFYHEDPNNGFAFEVKYTLMARICDDATRSSVRSTASVQSAQGLMRVILAKKTSFQVQRAFDIHSIPNALDPVVHKEHLWLSCAHQSAAIVSVQLDRSVFLAGDDIRMTLNASLPGSHRVKDITCSLQEHVTVDPNYDPLTFTLSRMLCKDPEPPGSGGRKTSSSAVEENTYDVTIPTQTNLISSFVTTSNNAGFKVSYSLAVLLKFSHSGGKLSFKVPIEIGPCAEPIYAEKISSGKVVPLFNRTTRFPCFSPTPTPPTGSSTPRQMNKDVHSTSTNSIPVETNMQCFTLPSLHPKTSTSCDYRAPPEHNYHKRPHYNPEPDKNGRMWAPDAFMPPMPFKMPSMIFEPINSKHRNSKIIAMLDHINKVNWTTSQDSRILPQRNTTVLRSTADFRHTPKMPTVTHTIYVDHGPQTVDRKIMSNVPSIGILPCVYPVPYTKERCVTANRVIPCLPAIVMPEEIPYARLDPLEGNANQYQYQSIVLQQ